jgi:hypothetical protein
MRTTIRNLMPSVCSLLTAFALSSVPVVSQESNSPQRQTETIEGTVVSSTRQTLVVRDDNDQFHLFVFNRDTTKPRSIPVGSRVRVESLPGEQEGTRLANTVTMLEAPKEQQGKAPTEAKPIPPKVRNVEHEIKREARNWRVGVRAGAAFDPELFLFGVHSQMGPIFNSNVFFRPNAEFAFGEVTDLIALNLEGVYRWPTSSVRGNWVPYVGAGPNLTFIHQSFKGGRDIEFGNFDFDVGFNVLLGMQNRRGTFVELKTSLYSRPAPVLRLIFGYNF